MSFNGAGFPGGMGVMPGAPGAPGMAGAPGVHAAAAGGFMLDIPADPTWEPFEQDDLLDQDGYYAARIKSERFVDGRGGEAGSVWIGVELLDDDVRGKCLSKNLKDPRATTKDNWSQWRSLFRSVYGLDGARASQRYVLGGLNGAPVYFRTNVYTSNNGQTRTGVDNWCTKEEYEKAVADKKHRWAPKPRATGVGMMGSPGALPGGLPPAFPGMGAPLPGAPTAPTGFGPPPQGFAPQPAAAAPMQPAPAAPQGFAPPAPQQAAPPQPWQQPAPPAQQPPAPPSQQWAPAPQQPPQGFAAPGFAPPPAQAAPTAPQPGGASAFPGFPGGPQPVYPNQS